MSDTAKAVFLSYASQDAEAAKNICEALRSAGVEVWFDQSELRGGDAWDQKIRKQIKDCALFVPVISANTQARREGYFRIEWKLAAQRTHAIAEGTPFLLPVLLDGVSEAQALVPSEFREVQWTTLSTGSALEPFATRVKHLADGSLAYTEAPRKADAVGPEKTRAMRRNSRLRLAAVGVVIALGAGVLFVSGLWRSPNAPAPVSSARSPSQTRTAALAGRSSIVTRDELEVDVERARRETEAATESAAAWSKRARLESQYIIRGWDVSDQRRQDIEAHAKRALAIDPGAVDAMYALAVVFLNQGAYAEAETLMRRAMQREPTDGELWQVLGSALSGEGRGAEALEIRQEALRRFPDNPIAHYDLALSYEQASPPDLEAALRKFDDSIALQPYPGTVLHKVSLLAGWKGDLSAAQRLLDTLDPLERTGDRAVGIAMTLGLLQHEPDRAIKAGGLTARSYFDDDYVRGPKAWLLAQAYAQAGKQSLALAQWREAEAVLRQRLQAHPENWYDQAGLAITLAWLGEQPEAASNLASVEAVARESAKPLQSVYLAYYYAGIGDAAKTVSYLQPVLERREMITGRTLPLDPWWDKVRGKPEFEALLKESTRMADTGGQRAKDGEQRADKTGSLPADAKSVVVLPFANLSGDPEQEYFSDGLTEEILNALARERDLRVPGRASAFSFKGKGASAAEIAKALNVAQLVEGSVRKSGNKVRISVQLTRAADGFSEALPTVERELTDIFALQDEVARVVVEKLTKRATTTAPIAVLTKVPEAYDAFLKGRALMVETSPSWRPALVPLQRAVELDPRFALAWANLGRLSALLYLMGFEPSGLAIARNAVEQALRLQPELAEGHLARAQLLVAEGASSAEPIERELALAEKTHPHDPEVLAARAALALAAGDRNADVALQEQAVQRDPRNGQNVNYLGLAYMGVGRFADAEAAFARAYEILGSSIPAMNRGRLYFHWTGDKERMLRTIDELPAAIRDDAYWGVRAMVHFWAGDYAGALDGFSRVSTARPGFRPPVFSIAEVREAMGDLVGARRDYEAALPITEKLCADYPESRSPRAVLALIYAGLGRKEEAIAMARKSVTGPGSTGSGGDTHLGSRAVLAQVLARFGQMDEALEIMRSLATSHSVSRHHLLISPDWRHLRKDPRFQAIAEGAPL